MMVDQIKAEMIRSLKAGEVLRTSVLRMLLSEIGYKRIDKPDMTDDDIVGVIQKEVKKRREAIEAYRIGGRAEQAATEEQELEILQEYLPQQLTESEIKDQISKIKEIGGLTDFGQIMKIVAPVFRGRAEGKVVADVVRNMIS